MYGRHRRRSLSGAGSSSSQRLVIVADVGLLNRRGQLVKETEEDEETEDYVVPPQLPVMPMYRIATVAQPSSQLLVLLLALV